MVKPEFEEDSMKKIVYTFILVTGLFFLTGEYSSILNAEGSHEIGIAGKIGYFVINGGDLKDPDFKNIFGNYDGNGLMLGGELDFYFNRMIALAFMVDYYNEEENLSLLGYSASINQKMVPLSFNDK